jgi:hypothetical protein
MKNDITLEQAEELLKIDKNNLDKVVCQQAEIFNKITDQFTLAVAKRDFMKKELSELDAAIAIEYRQKAHDNNEKLTEGKLNEKVDSDDRHSLSVDRFLRSKLEADRWAGTKEAFSQRASMIKLCCELYLSNYYSSDSMKSSRAVDDTMHREARKQLTARRKRVDR